MTHEIFAYLKHGYVAKCTEAPEMQVTVDKEGRYWLHPNRRDCAPFDPKVFESTVRWYIEYKHPTTFGGIFND